jgi:catechol 2,3-dioxygenase-like lactoylglutathione lyase family enzyme
MMVLRKGGRRAMRRGAAEIEMLKRVDRVQIVVGDRAEAVRTAGAIFGAEAASNDEVRPLGAGRTTVQAGASMIEFLEADGAGPVADFAARWGGGLYAAGFSVGELDEAAALFGRNGVRFERSAGQLFLDAATTGGMRAVISAFEDRAPVGAIKWTYEVTNVVADWRATAARYSRIFGLDPAKYVPIEHDEFGYTGTLTMFGAPARLDRIEIAQPNKEAAMGRFHRRRGDSLYMFYVETDNVEAIAQRLRESGGRFTPRREGLHDGMWIHPTAFCGVLVGVSRTNVAWRWSGDPQRGG